jgi:hypothetical protein
VPEGGNSWLSKSHASLQKKTMDKFKKRKTVSVNLNHALFSLLSTHDDLAMQAFFLLHRVWFRAIRFGTVWFGASYANLRGPQIFKLQI